MPDEDPFFSYTETPHEVSMVMNRALVHKFGETPQTPRATHTTSWYLTSFGASWCRRLVARSLDCSPLPVREHR